MMMLRSIKIQIVFFIMFLKMTASYGWAGVMPSDAIINQLNTGDIILEIEVSLDSMVIARVSQGLYSHIGLVYKDKDNRVMVLESYPNKGIVQHDLRSFIFPSRSRIFRLCVLQFKETDRSKLQEVLDAFMQYSANVKFDLELNFDDNIPTLEELATGQFNYYCTEMVNMSFQMAYGRNYIKWPNYYDVVYNHIKTQPAFYERYAAFYFQHKYLRMMKFMDSILNMERKVLLTPSGILESPHFNVIFVGEDLSNIPKELKVFIEV